MFAGCDVVMWRSSKGTPPVLPVFREGRVPPFQALLRHQNTMLHSKGQDWPFPASNVCLKDKPRQVLFNFGMLHVARLILEGWVFTSVQSIQKTPNKKQPKPPVPARTMFFLHNAVQGGDYSES